MKVTLPVVGVVVKRRGTCTYINNKTYNLCRVRESIYSCITFKNSTYRLKLCVEILIISY